MTLLLILFVIRFQNLQDLEFWGGDFYTDKLEVLLEALGPRLTRLDLHHVDGLDMRSLASLSLSCPRLRYLGFGGCGFVGPDDNDDDGGDVPYDTGDPPGIEVGRRLRDVEAGRMLCPMLEMEAVSVACPCPAALLAALLGACPNVKRIVLGINCEATDEVFDLVLAANGLRRLEELEARRSTGLSMRTVASLLLHCDSITSILDLDGWEGVGGAERDELERHMAESNVMIRLTDRRRDNREVSLYEMCQSALKEKYPSCAWEEDE